MSKKIVKMIDPPYGHRYGFPKIFDIEKGQDFYEWLHNNGYPKELMNEKPLMCRFWETEIDENDYRITTVTDEPYTVKNFAQDLERLFPYDES